MSRTLKIAIEIADAQCAKGVHDALRDLPDAETVLWVNGAGEKGGVAVKDIPDVIILDDHPETSRDIFSRVAKLRGAYGNAALFVVSANTKPEFIVSLMKAGVSQYLVLPLNPKVLLDSVEEVRVKLASAGEIAKGAVYAFISSKGGLGATVIAVNTAAAMARNKKHAVALSDMSLQSGDASVLLDQMPQTTLYDLCTNVHRLDVAFLRSAITHHKSGLFFLPAPSNPEEGEEITAEQIGKVLELARQLYDYIVVDCTSMRVDDRTMEVFSAAESVFVVTDLSVPALRNSARLCQLIEKMGIPGNKVEVAINRYIKGGTLSLEEVEKTLKKHVYWIFPNDFNDIVTSINRGDPLVNQVPGAPFSKSVMQFTDKLTNPHADPKFRGIQGLFGKAL